MKKVTEKTGLTKSGNKGEAQEHRSQEQNREDAINRLRALIQSVAIPRKKGKSTKPTKTSKQRRLERKVKRGRLKALRRMLE